MMKTGSSILLLLRTFHISLAATDYSPRDVRCPANIPLVRSGYGLSDQEADWIDQRDAVTREALIQWLDESELEDFNPSDFFYGQGANASTVRIGLAFSGGGYRAMLSGGGMMSALDSRTVVGPHNGYMGGLLQASSYVTGLSGGSWLVASVAANEWASVQSLQQSKDLWNFGVPFNPTPTHSGIFGRLQLDWDIQIVDDVLGKASSGFPISLTDIWGRYLSAQTIRGSTHGRGTHWSELLTHESLTSHLMPLPIILCDSLVRNVTEVVSLNSTQYEVSPFEFGSWDPSVYSFVITEFLGSSLSKGAPDTNEDCVIGYDNTGFIMGASSTLFNQIVQASVQASATLRNLYTELVKRFNGFDLDLAIIGENPFSEIDYVWGPIASASSLELVDGGEDGENIPFAPLLQPNREVDVIFAFDNSADSSHNWPSGDALGYTYQRQFSAQQNGTSFPYVPDADTMYKLGLTEQPVFFGCGLEPSEQSQGNYTGPLVVYLANSKHSYASNFSTFKLSYNNTERDNMLTNGYNVVTQNNGTLDSSWRTCVACSLVLREQQRRGEAPTDQCSTCFSRYCFEQVVESHSNMNITPGATSKGAKSKPEDRTSAGRRRRDGQSNVVAGAENLNTDTSGMYEQYVKPKS